MTDKPRSITRAYSFHAFPPSAGVEDFETQVVQRRALWGELAAIHDGWLEERDALYAAGHGLQSALAAREADPSDKTARKAVRDAYAVINDTPAMAAARKHRTDRFRAAKQAAASDGLHWSNYNDVVSTFEGAARGARGGRPGHQGQRGERATLHFQRGLKAPALFVPGGPLTLRPVNGRPSPRRTPGSHRSRRTTVRVDFALRTARNPAGPAHLTFEALLHRPIPPEATIVMAHVDRSRRSVVNRDGDVRQGAVWRLSLVCKLPARAPSALPPLGLALTWAGTQAEDGLITFAVSSAAGRLRRHTLDYGWLDDWAAAKACRDRAEAEDDAAGRVEAAIAMKRLARRRTAFIRSFVAGLARRHGVIAIQALDLRAKGLKNHAAPAEIRRELIRAGENHGCRVLDVKTGRRACHKCGAEAVRTAPAAKAHVCACGARWTPEENLARVLEKAAREAVFSESKQEKAA